MTTKQYIHAVLISTIFASQPLSAALSFYYDAADTNNSLTAWNNGANGASTAGKLDAKTAGGVVALGTATTAKTNFTKAYSASSSTFTRDAFNATYTYEIWANFGGSITDDMVIFESGGGTNGFGMATTANGIEIFNSSAGGGNLNAAVNLSTFDLTDFVQLTLVFDKTANSITVAAKDVNGLSLTDSATSAGTIGTGTGNGQSFFGGGNSNNSNASGDIGGSEAGNISTAAFFDGEIALVNIYTGDAIAAGDIATSYLAVVPEPSSYALLGGLCALSWVMVRRRR